MRTVTNKLLLVIIAILLSIHSPLAALACATCGCSELCAVNMFTDTVQKKDDNLLITNSIWGKMILRIAYDRDPELQRLAGNIRGVTLLGNGLAGVAAVGTLPQTVISVDTLQNTPDSYAPGVVGIVLEGVTNVALWTRMAANRGLRKKIKARETVIRDRVEDILHHLEFSQYSCAEAQKQFSELIGDKAAQEFIVNWQSSHAIAAADESDEQPRVKAPMSDGTPVSALPHN